MLYDTKTMKQTRFLEFSCDFFVTKQSGLARLFWGDFFSAVSSLLKVWKYV